MIVRNVKYQVKGYLSVKEAAEKFMACFEKFAPESIKNEYYTDLLTWLDDDIHVEHTKVHFIYAGKMGEEKYTLPVLKAIDEFMETHV